MVLRSGAGKLAGIRVLWVLALLLMLTAVLVALAESTERETPGNGCRRINRRQRRQQLEMGANSTNSSTSSSYAGVDDGGDAVGERAKHRLIRGSKRAVTITKREYLKTDWCKTEPFQQIIHVDGCLRTRILNRFCYGQCNSFYIPKSQPELASYEEDYELSDSAHFRSCAVCAPKKTDWATVVLRCPRLLPPFRRRRVRIVRHCKCLAVRIR